MTVSGIGNLCDTNLNFPLTLCEYIVGNYQSAAHKTSWINAITQNLYSAGPNTTMVAHMVLDSSVNAFVNAFAQTRALDLL